MFNILDDTRLFIPTPFKRGDILVTVEDEQKKYPFVFFGFESCGGRNPVGITIQDEADIEMYPCFDAPIYFEYFHGQLVDYDVLLKYVSKYYKGEISEEEFETAKKLATKGELDV